MKKLTGCTEPEIGRLWMQRNAGSAEVCGDDEDNDCDTQVDEPGASGCTTYYKDYDGDGYGSQTPSAGADPGEDCDDTDPLTHYGAAPLDSPVKCMTDADGDDWGNTCVVEGITNLQADAAIINRWEGYYTPIFFSDINSLFVEVTQKKEYNCMWNRNKFKSSGRNHMGFNFGTLPKYETRN